MPRTYGIDRGTFNRGRKNRVKLLADDSDGAMAPGVTASFDGESWTVSNVMQNSKWLMFELTPPASEASPDPKEGQSTLGDLTITITAGGTTSRIVAAVMLEA